MVVERDIKEALSKIGAQYVEIQNVGAVSGVASGVASGRVSALPQVKIRHCRGGGERRRGEVDIGIESCVGLKRMGATVGLMDGDIYGPSMPTMLGIKGHATGVVQGEDFAVCGAWDSCDYDRGVGGGG